MCSMQTTMEVPTMQELGEMGRATQRNRDGALGKARAELREANARVERFKKENEKLRRLIRTHHRAVVDGVGNWGETEAALFKAVGR